MVWILGVRILILIWVRNPLVMVVCSSVDRCWQPGRARGVGGSTDRPSGHEQAARTAASPLGLGAEPMSTVSTSCVARWVRVFKSRLVAPQGVSGCARGLWVWRGL